MPTRVMKAERALELGLRTRSMPTGPGCGCLFYGRELYERCDAHATQCPYSWTAWHQGFVAGGPSWCPGECVKEEKTVKKLMDREAIDCCRRIGRDKATGTTTMALDVLDALCDTAEAAHDLQHHECDIKEACADAAEQAAEQLWRDGFARRPNVIGDAVRRARVSSPSVPPTEKALNTAAQAMKLLERMVFGGVVAGGDMPMPDEQPAWDAAHKLALRIKAEFAHDLKLHLDRVETLILKWRAEAPKTCHKEVCEIMEALARQLEVATLARVEAPFSVEHVANSIRHQTEGMYFVDGKSALLTKDGWVHYLGGPIVQSWAPAEWVEDVRR